MFMERSYLHFSVILESKVITNKMFFLFFTNANKSKRMLYSSFIKIINKKVIYWFARRLYTNKPLLKRKGYFFKITGIL